MAHKDTRIEMKSGECTIPEFGAIKGIEKSTKQVEFLTERIRILDQKMITTKKPEDIAEIKREMHCRIKQLESKSLGGLGCTACKWYLSLFCK